MRSLNAILMMLGVLSTLMLGALPASAMSHDAPAPACHEQPAATSDGHGQTPQPANKPGKAMGPMACCAACVATAMPQPPERAPIVHARPSIESVPFSLPVGLSLQPEHGPPKG